MEKERGNEKIQGRRREVMDVRGKMRSKAEMEKKRKKIDE